MKKEEILPLDWHRILIGAAPAEFLIEVFLRSVIIYLLLLIVLRFMGKRMGGQLSITELSVMLMLGAIVSVGMQVPDKGILQGLLALVCAFVFQRAYTYFTVVSAKFEQLSQGSESPLVQNGVICTTQLNAMRISREQVFAAIRNKKIYNLGEIQRLYIEACGLFSILNFSEPKPGLALLPPGDDTALSAFIKIDDISVCTECGANIEDMDEATKRCKNCDNNKWMSAVLTKNP